MAQRFGNYEILRKIATGGMAEVFLAKQTGLGGFERLVCIKRILPHLGEQDDFITMFQDEARIAANLIHPNIAQIYDIDELDGAYHIAMEYVRGEDLRRVYNAEVAHGKAMPLPQAAQILMYASAGLDYAHRQTTIDGRPLGIVHRDISPQNVLVSYDGHVKIVDFGVAKAAVKMTETRSGVLKGKYSYMSPEQASGDPIDARTDIFALAITLYEITTGTRLFKRETELETLHAVIECDVTPPTDVVPRYDPALEAIIMRALSYDPDDRFPTAGEMEREIERFLISKNYPTSPSNLGTYMQDLFAEKLADELLFGGQPWDEGDTLNTPAPLRLRRSSSDPDSGTDDDHPATEISGPPDLDTTARDNNAWRSETHKPRIPWADEDSDTWGRSGKGSTTATDGKHLMPRPHRGATPGGRRLPGMLTPIVPQPRWLSTVALAVLLMGVGAGIALVLTSQRRSGGPMSGPVTVDSDPRGARVAFVGLGTDLANRRYDGHRTPFKVEEGLPVNVPLRARFIKDGFEIAEVQLPTLEASVTPPPIFVELEPGHEGSEVASLMLLSTPPGAEVWIDGNKSRDRTPLTDVRVRGGEIHKVEFRRTGYETRWESRYVEPGARLFIEVNLFPKAAGGRALVTPELDQRALVPVITPTTANGRGKAKAPPPKISSNGARRQGQRSFLNVTASMKLRVSVGSRYVGETPIRKLPLDAGVHRIKLESRSEGFEVLRKIRLAAGRTETIDHRPRKGKLAVSATPWAWVQIGPGAPKETPVRLELYEGAYRVIFECPDGRRREQNTQVVPGRTQSLSVNCRQ